MFIDGAPGIGNTILATEAANKLRDDNRNVVVAYINCKDIKSIKSFAGTVIEQICRSPAVDDPAAEIEKRLILIASNFFSFLFLDNFEYFLENNQQEDHPSTAAASFRDCREIFNSFIDKIAKCPTNIKFLVTSSEIVCFPTLAMERIHLNPFDKDESSELFEKIRHGDKIPDENSKEPLVLHTLISSQEDLIGLLKYFKEAPPEQRTNFFAGDQNSA